MEALGMDTDDFTNLNNKLGSSAFFFGINGTQVNNTGTPGDPTGADIVEGLYLARTDTADSVTLVLMEAPPPALKLSAAQATPSVIRTSGTVRVHWRSIAADKIVIHDGTTDVATFTSAADGQAFIDDGFVEFAVSSSTSYTVTASDATESDSSTTTVDVLTGGDPATYAETVLADNPVGYWQFEEAAGTSAFFDSSNNGADSNTIIGVIAGAGGAIGSGVSSNEGNGIQVNLQLDPQDPDGDDTPGDVDPDGVEGWSIEGLVRADTASIHRAQHIASNQNGTGKGRSNFFIGGNGALESYVGGATRAGTEPLRDAFWSHVVMTVQLDPAASDPLAPYTLRYYIDGVLDTEISDVPIEAADGDWVLLSGKTLGVSSFIGLLDEVSIYATTLDQARITAHYNAFLADPKAAPFLGFASSADTVAVGDSLTLSWKLSGTAATAKITDGQGNTVVADATASSSTVVSPTATTTYTLTVNGSAVADVTVTMETPIRITSAGFNAGGFFEVTTEGLTQGLEYDLFWSDDLVDWTPVGVPLVADETGIGTFADTVPYDPQTPSLFYRVEKLTP
jgi:hypothetical protein